MRVDFRAQAVFPLEHARANGVPVLEEAKETVGVSSLAQENRPPAVARKRPESRIPALWITNWLRGPDLNQRSAKTYAPVKAKEKQKVPGARFASRVPQSLASHCPHASLS